MKAEPAAPVEKKAVEKKDIAAPASFSWKSRAAWAAFALSAASAAWAGWEFYRESDVYAVMESAARSGDLEAYERNRPGWEKELDAHRRKAWIGTAGALALAGTGAALAWSGRKTHVALQFKPYPSALLAWSF